jgi:hypothetical protein
MRKYLVAVLALAACADNSTKKGGTGSGSDQGSGSGGDVSDADKQQDYNDVAASIGANLATGDLPSMVDAINMAYGRMPAGYTITQKTTSTGSAYQQLVGARGGLTVQYKLYCRDVANMDAACNGLEDQAHVKPTLAGTLTAANMSLDSIQRTAAWIVRDLAMPSAHLFGSGTNSYASHLSTGDYTLMVTDTIDALFDPMTPTTPTSGTFTLTINVQRTRDGASPADRTFAVAALITFIGPDSATLLLDQTQSYALTVSSGAVMMQ